MQNPFNSITFFDDSHPYECSEGMGDLDYGGKVAVASHPQGKNEKTSVKEALSVLRQ
jgi:hypothetical protein